MLWNYSALILIFGSVLWFFGSRYPKVFMRYPSWAPNLLSTSSYGMALQKIFLLELTYAVGLLLISFGAYLCSWAPVIFLWSLPMQLGSCYFLKLTYAVGLWVSINTVQLLDQYWLYSKFRFYLYHKIIGACAMSPNLVTFLRFGSYQKRIDVWYISKHTFNIYYYLQLCFTERFYP